MKFLEKLRELRDWNITILHMLMAPVLLLVFPRSHLLKEVVHSFPFGRERGATEDRSGGSNFDSGTTGGGETLEPSVRLGKTEMRGARAIFSISRHGCVVKA